MTQFNNRLLEVVQQDGRYAYEAYEFVFQALAHTQEMLGKNAKASTTREERHHVTGPELLEGARSLALQEFGLMARTVLKMWGINKTDDIGQIVFNLVAAELMSKTDDDSMTDFHEFFDLDQALVEGFKIQLDEVR